MCWRCSGAVAAAAQVEANAPGPPSQAQLDTHPVELVVQEEVLLQESQHPCLIPLPGWFAALFVEQPPHSGSFSSVLLGARLLLLKIVPRSQEEGRHASQHRGACAQAKAGWG